MKTKCCSKCGEVKELGEFYKHTGGKYGVMGYCKVCKKDYAKTYYKENADQRKEYNKKYYKENADQRKEYAKKHYNHRRKTDHLYRISGNTRSLTRKAFLNKGFCKTTRTYEILGCYYEELYEWLTTRANNNLTPYDKTHTDHVIPISWGQSEEEVLALSHYSNLQLLTPEENVAKRDRPPRSENYERVLATHPNPQLIKMIYGRKISHAQNGEARQRERV